MMNIRSTEAWAREQWGAVQLGDQRLNRRAVDLGLRMARHPDASLPQQMGDPAVLQAAYRFLNHPRIALEDLLAPHREHTLDKARQAKTVLWVQDTTVLDYTHHRRSKQGMGSIGDGNGYGLMLHSTLAVVPEGKHVLGLGAVQAFLRQPQEAGQANRWRETPEALCWRQGVEAVGPPPEGALWVHIGDREADKFEFMATCVEMGKHFVVRACRQRLCQTPQGERVPLMVYARQLPHRRERAYTVHLPARKGQPARKAVLHVAWGEALLTPPQGAPARLRNKAAFRVWVIRVWEADPPAGAKPVVWVLVTSLPVVDETSALEKVAWYCMRWLCEDYHQCLKTGCRIEQRQLDHYEDICRLLGFACPIAVRLLQLRQVVRTAPEGLALEHVDPWMVHTLARLVEKPAATLTMQQFWFHLARLGGFQWRKGDGQPGWRVLWRGWKYVADLAQGARLFLGTLPNLQDNLPHHL